jgi:uncharacterized protein YdaU (DUF1376 family)
VTSEKPFWFSVDPNAFLSDRLVDSMTALELGAVFRLLCRQWIDGSLPVEKDKLRRLARLSESEIDSCLEVIQQFFPLTADAKHRANIYASTKREEVMCKMNARKLQSAKANTARWGKPVSVKTKESISGDGYWDKFDVND